MLPSLNPKLNPSTAELRFLNPLDECQVRIPRPQSLQQDGYRIVTDLKKSSTLLEITSVGVVIS